MRTKLNKMSWTNRIILLSLLLGALTNPYSIGYISLGLDWVSEKFTLYGYIGFIVSLVSLALVNVYGMWQGREKITIPKKTAKSNHGMKFEETN